MAERSRTSADRCTVFQHGGALTVVRTSSDLRLLLYFASNSRDDFEVGDAGELGENFILNPVGKVGVLLVAAQVLERQHRN